MSSLDVSQGDCDVLGIASNTREAHDELVRIGVIDRASDHGPTARGHAGDGCQVVTEGHGDRISALPSRFCLRSPARQLRLPVPAGTVPARILLPPRALASKDIGSRTRKGRAVARPSGRDMRVRMSGCESYGTVWNRFILATWPSALEIDPSRLRSSRKFSLI